MPSPELPVSSAFLVQQNMLTTAIINFVFLSFVCLIPSFIISWRLYLTFWRVKTDRQITFKYEACAKLIWMFNKVILFPRAQNNKQFYHVRMCSNFIWQLRLWFGYAVTFIGNSASWVWLRTEHSYEKWECISFVTWKAPFKMLLQINGFLYPACIIPTHRAKQPICTIDSLYVPEC